MNRAARSHLLGILDRASRPLFLVSLPEASAAFHDALAEVIRGLGMRESIILPPASKIEIIKPRNAPRVVAGKGRRRRGVQVDPPRLFAVPRKPLPPGTWSNRFAA